MCGSAKRYYDYMRLGRKFLRGRIVVLFAANIAVVFLGGLEQLMAAVGGIRPAALPRVLTPRMNHAVAVHTSGPSVALPSTPPARNDPFRPPRWPLFLMAAYLAGVAVFGAR